MMQQELSLASASQQILSQKEALIKKQSEALDKIIQKALDV
jgi:hypothetical protein